MIGTGKLIKSYVLNSIAERSNCATELIPSDYWTDFANNFRYVYDLSEAELARIRYHTYHLTSDSYLTYYFANDAYKSLLKRGYLHFVEQYDFHSLDEGSDGIGIDTEFGRVSHDLLRYLGVACELIDSGLLDNDAPGSVIEIGGGYGGLARVHLTYNPKMTYFICDLEETLFFSSIYLSKTIGQDKVHLVEEKVLSSDVEEGHVYIVPQSKIEYLDSLQFSYAVNQQSFQEMTHLQVERYLVWIAKHTSRLYSCNICDHEAIANNKHLVLNLPKLLKSFFYDPIWHGKQPLEGEVFGDNHILRAVYKCD